MANKKASKPKQTKVKSAFALIRAKGPDAQLIEDLKKSTREKTNSGALLSAGKQYLQQTKTIIDLQAQGLNQATKIRELQDVIEFSFKGLQMLMNYGTQKLPKGKYPQRELFREED